MKKKNIKTGILTGQEIKILISDEASHRSLDENGRLLVRDTLLTRESADEYLGSEIPEGREKFGLDPDAVYRIYRPGKELKKAIRQFNGIPVLDLHLMDVPGEEQKESRVGAVSNARFDDGAVFADLTIWDADAIEKIQSGEKRELSCGYSAETYAQPGEFNGQRYDFIMKNLTINHLALVRHGRVPGAMVYDEKPEVKEPFYMEKEEIIKLLEPELGAAGIEKEAAEKILLKIKEYKAAEEAPAPEKQDEEPKPEEQKPAEPAPEPEAKPDEPAPAPDAEAPQAGQPAPETPEGGKKDEAPAPEEAKAEEVKEEVKEEAKVEEAKEAKPEEMPGFAEAVKAAVKAALEEISQAREAVEDVCGKMSAMDSADELYRAGCSYFGIKTDGRDPKEYKILFEGAKAGMSKASPKTPVLDEKPEQPAEEPEFLKNLPKRKY